MDKRLVDTNKPLYLQIKETILQQIESHELRAGDKLLSEAQFQKEFGVSRITVRKALDELVKEDYLTRLHGKGTFVKSNGHHQKTLSLTQLCSEQGKKLTSEVLSRSYSPVPERFAQYFSTNKLIRVERLRKIDGVAIMLEQTFFPEAFDFLLTSDLNDSLYQVLKKEGIHPEFKGRNQVAIHQLTHDQAKLFNVQSGNSVIHHIGTVYDSENTLVLISEELVRVDLPDLFTYYL
ncbi:GntR family transcriptional regulator [Enterococcus sp. AZ194]|uniref:GntR family transcriptional regulator n=1 Tax=Enterococcus sp. AZ194 TaxID=2774629 RepID=UPI003F28144F